MKPIPYLESRQLVNYIKLTLRTPKRLIPAIFIVLWFSQIVFTRIILQHNMPEESTVFGRLVNPEIIWAVVFGATAAISLLFLFNSLSESRIAFSLADVDFLFSAPISRRLILSVKMLKLYFLYGVYTAFFVVIVVGSFLGMPIGSGGVSFLIVWASVLMYVVLLVNVCTLINLVASYRDSSKQWLRTVILALAYGLLIFAFGGTMAGYLHTGDMVGSLKAALTHPIFTTLMLPVKWMSDMAVGNMVGEQMGSTMEIAFLGILAVLSYVLVVHRKENPYEPSLSVSIRTAAIKAALRTRDFSKVRSEQWKRKASSVKSCIAPFGRGAGALIWKNFNILWRKSGTQLAVGLVIVVVAFPISKIVFGDTIGPSEIQSFLSFALPYTIFLFASFSLHSLRGDMKQANILKPMPIPAWKVIAAQTIHGTVLIWVFTWVVVCMAAIVYGFPDRSPIIPIALVIPFVAESAVSAMTIVAALFPNWEDPGHRLMGSLLSMITIIITVGPSFGIGALLWVFKVPLIFIVPIVSTVALGMSAGCLALGGHIYKYSEPTEE